MIASAAMVAESLAWRMSLRELGFSSPLFDVNNLVIRDSPQMVVGPDGKLLATHRKVRQFASAATVHARALGRYTTPL